MLRARYSVVGQDWKSNEKPVVYIEDLDGDVSVTNDAEAVVSHLIDRGYGKYRIIYKDTMGRWDELCHDGVRFEGFAPANAPKNIA